MGPCHHGMARPQVADGSIWKVAANKLNKQLRTTENMCSSNLVLDEVLTAPHRKKLPCSEKDTFAWSLY
jgi:hypothetical protein